MTEPLNILFVTQGYKPAFRLGGPVVVAAALAEEMVRRGHRVTVVTTNSNLEENIDVPLGRPVPVDGVDVYYFERVRKVGRALSFLPSLRKSFGYSYAPSMRAFLQEHLGDYDLVHTHMPFSYPTMVASRVARRHGVPLFYHQHGILQPEHLGYRAVKKRAYIALVERGILRSANTLVALTEAEMASYPLLGVKTPCRLIPNGVDPSIYRTQPASPPASLPHDAKVVLYMGRVHPSKGVDRLLRGFFLLQADYPDAYLVVAGPDEHGLEADFRDEVQALGLEDRVLFPGMITGEVKFDLLARADLFVLPSDAEGFSIAVLEALASATPVLLSPACHFGEVETRGAGRVVPNDANAIEAGLRGLLDNAGALAQMGREGLELVREKYAWGTICDATIDMYRDGIARVRQG